MFIFMHFDTNVDDNVDSIYNTHLMDYRLNFNIVKLSILCHCDTSKKLSGKTNKGASTVL